MRKRYLDGREEFKQKIHRSLADYFSGMWVSGKPYEQKIFENGQGVIKTMVANRYVYINNNVYMRTLIF